MTTPIAWSAAKTDDHDCLGCSCPLGGKAAQPAAPGKPSGKAPLQGQGGNPAGPAGWEIKDAPQKPGASVQIPPCLANLLLDAGSPSFFGLTAGKLSYLEGGAGSCLDVFKTHVRDTVGVEAYLRAMGSMSPAALESFCAKALEAQGKGAGTAGPPAGDLADMMTDTAINLLKNEVASRVIAKLEVVGAAAHALAGSEDLRIQLIDRIASKGDQGAGVAVLAALGVSGKHASKALALASDGPEGMAEAQSILKDGIEDVLERIADLVDEIATWPLSKEIDLLTDLGAEVSSALGDMGIPKQAKGSALGAAIESHVSSAGKSHALMTGLKLLLGAAASAVAGGTALAAASALPALSADAKKVEDMEILHAVGSASHEAVSSAKKDLAITFVAALVPMPGTK